MTSHALARELEVAQRTVMRDIDALTEAGLPIVVHRGNNGGVELGFNYRTRLTGLSADEAEALAVILAKPVPELTALGLMQAGARARAKMLESFPDGVRERVELARTWFQFSAVSEGQEDERVAALAFAVRERRIVRINARSRSPVAIHPVSLTRSEASWAVRDELSGATFLLDACGDINVSARSFGQRA